MWNKKKKKKKQYGVTMGVDLGDDGGTAAIIVPDFYPSTSHDSSTAHESTHDSSSHDSGGCEVDSSSGGDFDY